MQRAGLQNVTAGNYISRPNTIVPLPPGSEVYDIGSSARARSEARPGVSEGGQLPVGGRFRQPDRTPFFGLIPAFGLRSGMDKFRPTRRQSGLNVC